MDRFLIILLVILVILISLFISNLRNNGNDENNNSIYCSFSEILGRGEESEIDYVDANESDDFDPLYGAYEGIKDDKLNDYLYDQFQKYIEETDHKHIEKYLKKLYKKKITISDEVKEKKLKYPKIYEYINKLIIKTDAKSPSEFLELVPIDYSKFLDTKTAKLLSLKKTIANVDEKVGELIIKLDKDRKLTSEQRNKLIDKLSVVAQKHRKFKLPIKKVSAKALKLMPLDIDILGFNEIAQDAVIKTLESEKKKSDDYDSTVYWWSLPWWKRPIYYYYWTDYEKLFNDAETRRNLQEIKRLLASNPNLSNLSNSTPAPYTYTSAPAPDTYAPAPAPNAYTPAPAPNTYTPSNTYTPAQNATISDYQQQNENIENLAVPTMNKYNTVALEPKYDIVEPEQKNVINKKKFKTDESNIESIPFDKSIFEQKDV